MRVRGNTGVLTIAVTLLLVLALFICAKITADRFASSFHQAVVKNAMQ